MVLLSHTHYGGQVWTVRPFCLDFSCLRVSERTPTPRTIDTHPDFPSPSPDLVHVLTDPVEVGVRDFPGGSGSVTVEVKLDVGGDLHTRWRTGDDDPSSYRMIESTSLYNVSSLYRHLYRYPDRFPRVGKGTYSPPDTDT